MKLDIEPASCQPTLAQKPSSKSVIECNNIVNDTESRDEKLKKGNERDVNCVASRVNRDGLWNVSEFDCSTSEDSTNANEDEARDYAQIRLYEKDMGLYNAKSVMECELPEIIVCYKESRDNVIKDICIDQGVTSLGEILFGVGVDEGIGLHNFLALEEDKSTGLVKPAADKDCSNDSAIQYASADDPVQIDLSHNAETEATEEKEEHEHLLTEDFISGLSDDRENGVNKPSVEIPYEEATSKNSDSVSAADESNSSTNKSTVSAALTEESNNMVEGFKFGKEESSQNGDFVHLVTQNMSKLEDGKFSDQARHNPGESSFSMTGPISGLITYSGQIAYAGSCSMRSDSSTTSTRSFAFPVLQAEWNSSPVRMRKAERRHKGCWRDGLLCCRF